MRLCVGGSAYVEDLEELLQFIVFFSSIVYNLCTLSDFESQLSPGP